MYFTAFLFIMVLMTALWLVSIVLKNVSIVDPFWSVAFMVAGVSYYIQADGYAPRQTIVLVLTLIWGARLCGYLLWRNWGKGEDYRYQEFRRRYGAERYWWFSFFQVFLLQGFLAWLISAPLLGAQLNNNGSLNLFDFLGVGVWLIGFIFEAGGDWQLARFKASPANKGKLLTTGLWRYTRHPNYFGDAAVWWGFALLSVAGGSYWPILSAVLMTWLITKVSGVALIERTLPQSKPGYEEYVRRTSPFFPMPPKR
jgi:steroid 5-alpha reductase family enzyme